MKHEVSAQRRDRLRIMLRRVISDAQNRMRELRESIRDGVGERRSVGDVIEDVDHETANAAIASQSDLFERTLSEASEALRRLEANDGSYGVCDACGDEIAEARLTELPFAARCLLCQSRVELVAPITRRQSGAYFQK
jgi:DnaK suppressor protein